MDNNYVKEYREKLGNLTPEEKNEHEVYLKKLANGEIQGPPTAIPSLNKVQNQYYEDAALKDETVNMNLYDYMFECNKDHMDDIAIEWESKITYRELKENTDKMIEHLRKNGVKQGDVISIAMTFVPETIYAVYALSKIGATFNLCDPRVPEETFINYMNNVETLSGKKSNMLLTYDIVTPKIKRLIDKTGLEKVVSIRATQSVPKYKMAIKNLIDKLHGKNTKETIIDDPRFVRYEDFINTADNNLNTEPSETTETIDYRNMPAGIIYTSGTTGIPKGAVMSNGSINSMAQRYQYSVTNLKRGDKFLLIMPPFIAYGLVIGLHSQLCAGQCLALAPDFSIANSKELIPKLIKKYHPQTIMGVPNFVNELIENEEMDKTDFHFLKNFIVGGDGITEKTEISGNEFFRTHNSSAIISKGWGLTELASCVTYTKSDIENKVGSVGIPATDVDIRVLNTAGKENIENLDDEEELGYNQEGELYVAAPTQMLRYVDLEKQKGVFYQSADGNTYVRTMDLGHVDDEGNVYISGRIKRIVVRPDGHNVSPFAIEEILNSDPRIKNCAVVGRKAEEFEQGHWPVAYIELNEEYKNMGVEEEIIEKMNKLQLEKLPPRDVTNLYEFIDELPLTDIGKINYAKLQQQEDSREMPIHK